MSTYSFEERKHKDKIEKEVQLFANSNFPTHTAIKVEQDIFKEWYVTIFQGDSKLFHKRYSKWSTAIRFFEDQNQPAPGTFQQFGLF